MVQMRRETTERIKVLWDEALQSNDWGRVASLHALFNESIFLAKLHNKELELELLKLKLQRLQQEETIIKLMIRFGLA